MNVRIVTLAAAVALSGLWAQGASADVAKAKRNPVAQAKAAREAMLKAAKPGPHHERLRKMVGEWKTVTRDFSRPGRPVKTHGTAKMRMILGGRFLVHEFSGASGGIAYEGMGVTGYDNVKGKYVDVWMDEMSTAITTMEGTCDDAKGVCVSRGSAPMPDGSMAGMRSITTDKGPDEFLFEMFVTGPDRKEKKVFEITYTRVE